MKCSPTWISKQTSQKFLLHQNCPSSSAQKLVVNYVTREKPLVAARLATNKQENFVAKLTTSTATVPTASATTAPTRRLRRLSGQSNSQTTSSASSSLASCSSAPISGAGGSEVMINLSKDIQTANNNVLCTRKQREFIPDSRKDETYWDRRRKNNEAAKRSREKRRISDLLLETRVLELTRENALLHAELYAIKEEFGLPPSQHFINPDSISAQMPDLGCRTRRASVRSLVATESTSETGSTSSSIISTSSSTSSLLNSISAVAAAAAACQAAACQPTSSAAAVAAASGAGGACKTTTTAQQQQVAAAGHLSNYQAHEHQAVANAAATATAAQNHLRLQHEALAVHNQLQANQSHLHHLAGLAAAAAHSHQIANTNHNNNNKHQQQHQHHNHHQQQQHNQLDLHRNSTTDLSTTSSFKDRTGCGGRDNDELHDLTTTAGTTASSSSSCLPLKLRHKYRQNSSSLYC